MDVEMNLSVENGAVEAAPEVVEAVAVNGDDVAENHIRSEATLGAPGDGRPAEKVAPVDYNTDFPSLPMVETKSRPAAGAWGRKPPVVKAPSASVLISLTAEERAARGLGQKVLTGISEEQSRCDQIRAQTGARVDIAEARDGSVNIIINGKPEAVAKARSLLVRTLQAQITTEVSIPKDHHRIIIGKEGSNLQKIQAECDCKIDVPKRDNNSDIIKITGPSDGVAKAKKRLEAVSAELAKNRSADIDIPKLFYPWLRGPNNEFYDKWTNELGVRINIPPPLAKTDVIVVTGEREAVDKVEAAIRAIYNAKKNVVKTITVKVPCAQHRYIVGPQRSTIHEILRQTDVVVEVPAEGEDCDDVTLRGEETKLGEALTLVYSKATSVVSTTLECKPWMHKMLIGKGGDKLTELVPNKDKVKIDFEKGGIIYIEGAPKEVETATEALNKEIERLDRDKDSQGITVKHKHAKELLSRNRTTLNSIRGTGGDLKIVLPEEMKNENEDGNKLVEIRVEGDKKCVAQTIKLIKDTHDILENEKSEIIKIPQRFHGQFIGPQGSKLNEARKKYPSLNFSFPEASANNEGIEIRGDPKEVKACFNEWTKRSKELEKTNYQETIPVYKEFCKHIIGKGGSNISKIRQETGARIDLPALNSADSHIVVTGRPEEVQKAVSALNALQEELSNIDSKKVNIPSKVHFRFVAGGRRLLHEIEKECGGVFIKFPAEKSNSDEVIVRGPKDDVARAVEKLQEMAKNCEETSFEDSVLAKPEYHRFFIGKGGSKINKLADQFPTVRVMFPREADTDKERIHFIGAKDEVAAVKRIFEQQIAELNEQTEKSMDVDTKWHGHFVSGYAKVLNEVISSNGNVSVSFPRKGSEDTKVVIKGPKNCVESAHARINEIVDDLKAQITMPVPVASVHHRTMLSSAGRIRIKNIEEQFNVRIKFPERRREAVTTEADSTEDTPAVPRAEDQVHITGRDTNCEKAREALLECVPVSRVVLVPADYHRNFIGKSGENVRQLMNAHDVNIKVPGKGSESANPDEITVTGVPENVEAAIADILELVEGYNKDAEDKKLKMFRLDVVVDPKYHQRLIGPKGSEIRTLRERHNVQISFPPDSSKAPRPDDKRRDVRDPTVGPDVIILTGYEHDCEACKEEILGVIAAIESQVTAEIELDPRYHPRLIGQRGRNLREVQNKYHVEIRLPRKDDPNANPSLVVVAGKNEEDVDACIDFLRNEEEDYMQDIIERYGYMSQRAEPTPAAPPAQVFEIRNAPWQLTDEEQFPAFPGESRQASSGSAHGVWGNRANRV